MIDEETLTRLLADHAERIPVPDSAIADLLAASPRAEHTASTVQRLLHPSARLLAAAAVVIVAAAGVWAIAAHSDNRFTAASARGDGGVAATPSTSAGATFTPPGVGAGEAIRNGGESLNGAVPTGGTTSASRGGVPAVPPTTSGASGAGSTPAPTDTARVIRTGTLDLRIARHTFGETIGRITTTAAAAGGFIADAKTFESAAIPSGTVTIRVPSARFNDTVTRLRRLGTVVSASTRGVDVTGQYTDLQARLHAATATRDQYLTVLAQATNIGDILAVQDRIQGVQTQIEELQGQINSLTNQTTYATITISVTEPGPKAKPIVKPHHQSGVSVAWDNARSGFARRVEGLISHSGSALVVLVGLLLAATALRLLLPRVRRLLV